MVIPVTYYCTTLKLRNLKETRNRGECPKLKMQCLKTFSG